jgi:hypothetical protein
MAGKINLFLLEKQEDIKLAICFYDFNGKFKFDLSQKLLIFSSIFERKFGGFK